MGFRTGKGGDDRVHGQSIPCRCGDGFITLGGVSCLHCGRKVVDTRVGTASGESPYDATDWDELAELVGVAD